MMGRTELLKMAKRFEKPLFFTAPSLREYKCTSTLEERLDYVMRKEMRENGDIDLQALPCLSHELERMEEDQNSDSSSTGTYWTFWKKMARQVLEYTMGIGVYKAAQREAQSESQECTSMENDSDDIASSYTESEISLSTKLRQLGTRKRKAEHVVDILIGHPCASQGGGLFYFDRPEFGSLLSLLDNEPSIVRDSSNPSEESLFHHLCNWCQNAGICSICGWEPVLWKVLQASPEAVRNDPAILTILIGVFRRHDIFHEGWLNLIGTVGEQCPEAYDELVEDLPFVKFNWRRLLPSCRTEETSLFDSYPHLTPHMTDFLVDLSGISGESTKSIDAPRPEENNDDEDADFSFLTRGVDEETTNNNSSLRREEKSDDEDLALRSDRIQQILSCIAGQKEIVEIGGNRDSLRIRCRPRKDNQSTVEGLRGGRSLRLTCMELAQDVLLFSSTNVQPMQDCFMLVKDDHDAELVTRLLPGCKVLELCLCVWPISRGAFDGIVRMVARHSTIQSLILSQAEAGLIDTMGDVVWIESRCLAELVNLHSLQLHLVVREVAPQISELLASTCQLERLDLYVFDDHGIALVMEAVGQSTSLREFMCIANRTSLDLRMLLHGLETSNTSLERCWLELTDETDETDTEEQVESCHGSRTAIDFYCHLNLIGRRKLRQSNLSKEELVVDMVGTLGSRDKVLERLFPQVPNEFSHFNDRGRDEFERSYDSSVTSLLYGLLRENPAIWCA